MPLPVLQYGPDKDVALWVWPSMKPCKENVLSSWSSWRRVSRFKKREEMIKRRQAPTWEKSEKALMKKRAKEAADGLLTPSSSPYLVTAPISQPAKCQYLEKDPYISDWRLDYQPTVCSQKRKGKSTLSLLQSILPNYSLVLHFNHAYVLLHMHDKWGCLVYKQGS